MAYIGPEPNPGQNREVDDISSSFNGSTTAFTLQVNSQNVSPGSSNSIIVSLGGVVQNPSTDYTINSSTITFSTAPASGLSFFGLVLGQGVDAVEPADGSVSTIKIADQAVTLAKLPHGTASNNGKFLRANNGADPTFETVTGTTINNNADDRVITGSGTANTLNGEANLTYNGTLLTVTGSNEADMLHLTTGNSAGNTFAGIRGDNESGIKIRGGGSFDGGTIELGGGLRDTDPGIIRFSSGTGSSVTERMRIASGGAVTFNSTGDVGGTQTGVRIQDPEVGTCRFAVSTTASDTHIQFLNNSANSVVGSITTVSSSTAYNTSSDYRLKENVSAISDGITRLKTLKPSRFNFKGDTGKTLDGFLAHEVTAVPEAITGEKDAVAVQADVDKGVSDKVGDPIYQQIDQSRLVPLLTAALQEAITKIETLETKVAALEAA